MSHLLASTVTAWLRPGLPGPGAVRKRGCERLHPERLSPTPLPPSTAPRYAHHALLRRLPLIASLQAMDKLIIHMVNTCGRVHANHLAVVTSEKLFLKRNLPVVCREMLKMYTRRFIQGAMVAAGLADGAVAVDRATVRARWVKNITSICDKRATVAHTVSGWLRDSGRCALRQRILRIQFALLVLLVLALVVS